VFTSPDPLLTPTDPQDLNPYAYAQDSAPSVEDPTGQVAVIQGFNCNGLAACLKTGDSNNPGSSGSSGSSGGSSSPAPGKSASGTSDEGPWLSPSNSYGQCNILGEYCNLPPIPAQPPVTVVKPKIVVNRTIFGPGMGCVSQFEFKYGACPGERGQPAPPPPR
jgi:hypothetical protein